MRVLILGAGGMLGHTVLRYFAARQRHDVSGTMRSPAALQQLPADLRLRMLTGVDVESSGSLERVFAEVRPQAVINCVGVVKQLAQAEDPLTAIPINSLLPHRLARHCADHGARLLHVSTDCVFAGTRGAYREDDLPDALDLYGRSKLIGEVDHPHAITLRTSIIGPELGEGRHGLFAWFMSQQGAVRGYTKAVFSGLPTVELARVMHDFVLPDATLRGLYHVAAEAIDKYSLLREIARIYGKEIRIEPDDKVVIDRSLDGTRFRQSTGYAPRAWPDLLREMHAFDESRIR